MSKAVSDFVGGVGDAVSGVVKGVVNVVSDVAKGVGGLVEDIGKSDLGKALVIAGAVYFGGAALMGGFGEAAAGGEFLAGMGAGVESAATTLSSAWSTALGGDIAGAASSVGNAWGTASTAGEAASAAANASALETSGTSAAMEGGFGSGAPATTAPVTPNALPPGTPLNPATTLGAETGQAGVTASAPGAVPVGTEATTASTTATGSAAAPSTMTGPGLGAPSNAGISPYSPAYNPALDATSKAATDTVIKTGTDTAAKGFWASQDPLVKYGAISAGTQVVGGLISGAGQAKAAQEARDYELAQQQLALQRHNANVGGLLDFSPFANAGAPQAAYDPASRYRPPPVTRYAPPVGLASRYMQLPARA